MSAIDALKAVCVAGEIVVTDRPLPLRLRRDLPRLRIGVDRSGRPAAVEDLPDRALVDEAFVRAFIQSLALRMRFGMRALDAAGAPIGVAPYSPGLALDDVIDLLAAQHGSAPPELIAAAGVALAVALEAFPPQLAPSDDAQVFVRFDGVIEPWPRPRLPPLADDDHDDDAGARDPRLMPPEGLAARREPAMVYRLGVALHRLAFGLHPYIPADVDVDMAGAAARCAALTADGPRLVNPDGREGVERLALQCTDRDPRRRPPFLHVLGFLGRPARFDVRGMLGHIAPAAVAAGDQLVDELPLVHSGDAPSRRARALDLEPWRATLRTPGVPWPPQRRGARRALP